MDYKILLPIALGEPGQKISRKTLEDAGVNIDALIASGHLESPQTVTKTAPEPKE
jgi:hypothetical protein